MIRALLCALVAAGVPAAGAPAAEPWTIEKLRAAAEASGKPIIIEPAQFAAIQSQKEKALAVIEQYLHDHFKRADKRVLEAFRRLPREYYHYHYANKRWFATEAYEVPARPRAIGFGSALSDYVGQAYMTQLAQPKPGDRALEIGTGSGFQASALSYLVREVYSIEIISPLGKSVAKVFAPLGIANVHSKVGDGYYGWPEVKEGFDIIISTCTMPFVPPALIEQLRPGGRLIVPVGQPFKKGQFLYVYQKDAQGKVHSRRDMGVYFVPMKGAVEKAKPTPETAPQE